MIHAIAVITHRTPSRVEFSSVVTHVPETVPSVGGTVENMWSIVVLRWLHLLQVGSLFTQLLIQRDLLSLHHLPLYRL